MLFIETVSELRQQIAKQKQNGESIVLVPTMGNLHEGHLQLIDIARQQGDFVVCSIFVNPTQFGEGEDFDSYPRTLEQDRLMLEARGCDLLFYPQVKEVYPDSIHHHELSIVRVTGVSEGLCGGTRPGHFDGVATVVSKLFNMVLPDKAVFGEKDFQQLAVIRKMTKDLNFPIDIIGAPIVREHNGLAMSSRNNYLSSDEKNKAAFLFQLLTMLKQQILAGDTDFKKLQEQALNELEKKNFKSDYIEIRNSTNLKPAQTEDKSLVILLAAYLGKTRLIDNLAFDK